MKLTKDAALKLLKSYYGKTKDDGWIDHSICVGNSAGIIAEALGLDKEKAETLGYIHDIGKGAGEFSNHVMDGYSFLKEAGYDEEYYNISLTHSYLNNDYMCTAGGIPKDIPFKTNFIKNHQYTIYEKIISLCDIMCKEKFLTLEGRLIELMIRRGIHENTLYHIKEAKKLKKEIDKMLGYNLYKLFPDAIYNL